MKKKFFIFLLAIISVVCLAIGISACDNSDENSTFNSFGGGSTNNSSSSSVENGELVYSLNENGTYTVTADGEIAGELIIPSIYSGIAVTEIGEMAFMACFSLTSVTIPDSVTYIGEMAFMACETLTSLTIPDSVTYIGDNAFHSCVSLTTLTIGNSVVSIGDYAFENCTSLLSVTIPDSVISIGSSAFSLCTSLTSVTIGSGVKTIGSSAFYSCWYITEFNFNATAMEDIEAGTTEIFHSTGIRNGVTVKIGSNVTKIPARLFSFQTTIANVYGLKIISLVFEENSICESIGEYAFAYCNNLETITVPESITTIGNGAFYNCTALKQIYFNATSMESLASSINRVFYCAGQDGDGIAVTIGKNVTKIPAFLFYPYDRVDYSPKITNVVFEEDSNCKSIGSSAFSTLIDLKSIAIPDSVTVIGSSAFYGCKALSDITIGKNVTTIYNYAFAYCSSLTNVIVPDNVALIGKCAFQNCSSLASITLPYVGSEAESTENTHFGYIFGAADYASNADYVPSSLTTITITGGTNISSSAFYGCSNIIKITLPFVGGSADAEETSDLTYFGYIFGTEDYDGSTAVEQYSYPEKLTYYIPNNLTTVTITGGKSIFNYAFYNCSSLTNVTISGNITSIGNMAFTNCTSLLNIAIGENVTTIGYSAFSNCSSLISITISENVTPIGDNTFLNCYSLKNIAVKSGNTHYKSVDGNLYSYDGTEFIQYATGKTNVNFEIPEGVTTIDDYAVNGAESLITITLPQSVVSIGVSAFAGCTALTSVIV